MKDFMVLLKRKERMTMPAYKEKDKDTWYVQFSIRIGLDKTERSLREVSGVRKTQLNGKEISFYNRPVIWI